MNKNADFCQFFYSSHYLPIAHYVDGAQKDMWSSLDNKHNVFYGIESEIFKMEQNPAVLTSSELGIYGLIRVDGTNEAVIVGPVFSGEVSDEAVYGFMRKNAILVENKNEISAFLASLPKYTYNQFLSLLAFLHLNINKKTISVIEHFHLSDLTHEQQIAAIHTIKAIESKEKQETHGTYHFERELFDIVRSGDVEKLNNFLMLSLQNQQLQEGTLAENPLRQAKNLLIGLVTMVGKVGAIEGGMDEEEAYSLIDLYIQECEKAQSVEIIKILQYNLMFDFTERVQLARLPKGISKEINAAVKFIKNHTNDNIGIDDVADHIGRSRAYLTKEFKKEIGETVNDFIVKCKLNDAKSLLKHSKFTLSEISNYLCFSSQSYFQNLFKHHFGITPGEYRKKHLTVTGNE